MPLTDPYNAFPATDSQTVGTSSVQLASHAAREVLLQADPANTGTIALGNSSVTMTTNLAAILSAGQSIILPLINSNLIYVIASGASQKLYYSTFR